jgi:hypothetical protein
MDPNHVAALMTGFMITAGVSASILWAARDRSGAVTSEMHLRHKHLEDQMKKHMKE